MKSVMKHNFSNVPKAEIPRSSFNRCFGHKTTFNSGYLIPIYLDETLPGDTFNLDAAMFARLSTPIYPIMDNLHMDTFFFAVPYRLLWDNFEKMMGEQVDPGDSTDYTIPQIVMPGAGCTEASLFDYFGIPPGVPDLTISALFSRAYNLIYNEWFRDENIIDSLVVDTDNGPDTFTDYVLKRRGKRHDYFTSCLPWPQKDPDSVVSLPLGDNAPVTGIGKTDTTWAGSASNVYETGKSGTTAYPNLENSIIGTGANEYFKVLEDATDNPGYPAIFADLSNATAATINDLREAFQLQRMLERDARGGTRYTEIVKSHFGVTSPDARLQRPEYLGGNTARVQINPVAQTSESNTTKQGTLAGIGTITVPKTGFIKSFTEHCIIIGLVNVRADLTYQQGLNRMFSRLTRFDHYWPALAHLGEQEVLTQEIFASDPATDTGATGTPDNERVFGYQERWAEYRYKPSLITGAMRSSAGTPLDAWHLSQEFSGGANLPTLSETFIEENPPVSRIVAVPSEPQFIFDSYFKVITTRPMPTYSVPGLIDHF